MKDYQLAVNLEWTSKCNARCVMCPQSLIQKPRLMTREILHQALERINVPRVFRCVIAGYGEPTSHPDFNYFVQQIGQYPVHFNMVSNGQLLNWERLQLLDGRIGTLIISFSSVEKAVYNAVHVGLDQEKVMQNIILAQQTLQQTRLAISLTPMHECLDTLPQTIAWLKQQGVAQLTMSPTLYNRGTESELHLATQRLRHIISKYRLHSQELDFVPSLTDIARQYYKNDFKCVARNSDLFITSSGDYLYCYNNISHQHTIGHVKLHSVDDVLKVREKLSLLPELCNDCNMKNRYRLPELMKAAGGYVKNNMRF